MDWKEYLKHIRLAEIKDVKVDQAGVVNVKVENHYYHFHFPDPPGFKKVQEADFTPELEEKIKKEVANRLVSLGIAIDALPETSMKEVVVSTSLAAMQEVFVSTSVAIKETVNVTLQPITASSKGTVGPPPSGKSEKPKK